MTSWRTTAIGLVGAIATSIIPVLQGTAFTLRDLILAATIAALGVVAKDFNVSGK